MSRRHDGGLFRSYRVQANRHGLNPGYFAIKLQRNGFPLLPLVANAFPAQPPGGVARTHAQQSIHAQALRAKAPPIHTTTCTKREEPEAPNPPFFSSHVHVTPHPTHTKTKNREPSAVSARKTSAAVSSGSWKKPRLPPPRRRKGRLRRRQHARSCERRHARGKGCCGTCARGTRQPGTSCGRRGLASGIWRIMSGSCRPR